MNRKRTPRRGAILLVVLSVLVLFALVGVTFVVTAAQFKRAADAGRTNTQQTDAPERDADDVMKQLLRDTRIGSSSDLKAHGLLTDMYGRSLRGMILAANARVGANGYAASSGQQLIVANFQLAALSSPTDPSTTINNTSTAGYSYFHKDYYSGNVLTFTSGTNKGKSTRIVSYDPGLAADPMGMGMGTISDSNQRALVYDAITESGEKLAAPAVGDEFLINDKPFDGTGFGYKPTTSMSGIASKLDLTTTASDSTGTISVPMPVALAPRFNRYAPQGKVGGYLVTQGGADESYDAADLQNLALSYVPIDTIPVPTTSIIPSFHRPELAQYWFEQIIGPLSASFPTLTDPSVTRAQQVEIFRRPFGRDWIANTGDDFAAVDIKEREAIAAVRRRIIFRPEFSNETSAFRDFLDSSDGGSLTYDVDNDRDGVAESIWIDPGLPVKTAKDGRRYKTLAAIYVRDMDGLLNMNAHGALGHFDLATNPPTATIQDQLVNHNGYNAGGVALNANGSALKLPIGLGYGPADVNLRDFFANTSDYFAILKARYSSTVSSSDQVPGQASVDDQLSRLGSIGRPNIMANYASRAYGEPADFQGRSRLYIDYNGQPRWTTVDKAGSQDLSTMDDSQVVDDPYEFNLIRDNANDSKFQPAELEQLLRYGDTDGAYLASNSANRLGKASNTFYDSSNPVKSLIHRRAVTTESMHVPALPRAPVPDDLRDELSNFATILDLARERCVAEMVAGGMTTDAAKQSVEAVLDTILPFEIRHGEPFDLNRLLETPNDITSLGGVQTPLAMSRQDIVLGTTAPFDQAPYNSITPGADGDTAGNYLNGDSVLNAAINTNQQHRASRQLYARHLFCLMMLLTFEHDSAATANIKMRYKLPNFTPNHTGQALSDAQQRELTVRRIAQWAINVVDYRDKDGIMTPFEYDVTPFNGWGVDGDINTDEYSLGTNLDRRVVWGCEFPDLVVTESLAFHDRRAKDTAYDSAQKKRDDMTAPDADLDQYRIPEGSLFLELFCPRNSSKNDKSFPLELYTLSDNGTPADPSDDYYQLDLNRLSPPDANSLSHPVWRVVVAKPTNANTSTGQMTPRQLANVADPRYGSATPARNIEGVHFQPKEKVKSGAAFVDLANNKDPGFYGPIGATGSMTPDELQIERIVWLANVTDPSSFPDYEMTQGAVYTNNSAYNTKLTPGQYAVVGPRLSTTVSSKPDMATVDGDGDPQANLPGDQKFTFTAPAAGAPSVFTTTSNLNSYPTANIQRNLGIICQALEPRTADIKPASAALAGTGATTWNGSATQVIGMSVSEPFPRPNDPTTQGYYPKPNVTLDNFSAVDGYTDFGNSMAGTKFALPKDLDIDTYLGVAMNEMTGSNDLSNQTVTDFRTALVQRLADPTLPHDKTTNPYITIDWKTIDLTIYNGEDDYTGSTKSATQFDPSATSDPTMATIRFIGRERGAGLGNGDNGDLWRSGNRDGASYADKNVGNLTSSLAGTPTNAYFDYPSTNTLGYLNAQMGEPRPVGGVARYVGSPYSSTNPTTDTSRTFSWLQWANRPLISKYELMQVPTSAPQRLLFEYDLARSTQIVNSGNPTLPYSADGNDSDALTAPFPYLFNFFHSKKTENVSAGSAAPASQSAQFARVFDFVDVPSSFVDTKVWFNPTASRYAAWAAGYRPPFNRRLRFREPGRINLNTIPSKLVYDAVFDEDVWKSSLDNNFPDFDKLKESRRGETGSTLPTKFGNPFRSSSSAELAPLSTMKARPVEGSVLRSNGVLSSVTDNPLFDMNVNATNSANQDLIAAVDTGKNPMFRYLPYHRLGNLTTTQSNVYAVWITLGYFEVQPTTISSVHPDGWQLGQELGSDTGEITRNRSFYLIDRSIPVGYEPGEDHNVEDTVLLKRRID